MSQAPAMPVFTDALIGDTTHLSAEEFGSYFLLLCATWRNNGQAFEDDDRKLARICRTPMRRWLAKIRPAIVGFFNLNDGTWRQKRLEKEWQFVAKQALVSRTNGALGGRPKNLNSHDKENPAGFETETQTESTHTHTHKETPQTPQGAFRKRDGKAVEPGLPIAPEWAARCRSYGKGQRWDPMWGPEPGQPACGAPQDLADRAVDERCRRARKEAAD